MDMPPSTTINNEESMLIGGGMPGANEQFSGALDNVFFHLD
jgi:hypothetical protein